MAKRPPIPRCSDEDRRTLEMWAHSRSLEARLVERAKIIIGSLEGKPVNYIARGLRIRPNTVIEWRHRVEQKGIEGVLMTCPAQVNPLDMALIFAIRYWPLWKDLRRRDKRYGSALLVAEHLKSSVHAVWRVLRREGICLARQNEV